MQADQIIRTVQLVHLIKDTAFSAGCCHAKSDYEKTKEFKDKADDLVEELKTYLRSISGVQL